MTLDAGLVRPWRLLPNRVDRFYRGGLLLERFRGLPDAADSTEPEDWVGSATRAWTPPGRPPADAGLGDAEIDGRRHRIADLLAADPEAVAGAAFAPTRSLGVLVKLLDAGIRLPVHCHPDRAFARHHLDSCLGKAEAWLVQETREIGRPEDRGVWIGFRRDVGREELRGLIEAEDTVGLLDAMHHRPTQAGDVWVVPPGTPHAIGAGVFLVEVQEPTDFSIVAETKDVPIDAADAHLGLGWDVAIDAFDRAGHDDAWIDGLHRRAGGANREPLVDTPWFRAERLTVAGSAIPVVDPAAWTVAIVTGGAGRIRAGDGELAVRRGDTVGIPAAAVASMELRAEDRLEVLLCTGKAA